MKASTLNMDSGVRKRKEVGPGGSDDELLL